MSSYRIPGYGENRDGGAPGLMIFGLHNDLQSSDSSDSDYCPHTRTTSGSEFDSDFDSDESVDVDKKLKKRKKQESWIARKKRKLKGEMLEMDYSNKHSSSSDISLEAVGSRRKATIVTRDVERKRRVRESLFPHHSTPPCIKTWGSLPTEILAHIFSHVLAIDVLGVRYLCRCAQVCQNWHLVATQSVGWQGSADLSFLGGKDVAKNELLVHLSTRFAELKELNLRGWRQMTDVGVSAIAKYCAKLRAINLSNCQKKLAKISMDSFLALANNTELQRVNFSNLRLTNTCKFLISFIEIHGVFLTHIYCSDNVSTGSIVLTSICENCPNLQVLDLSNTSVRSICFPTFQRKCSKMKELFLANLSVEPKVSNYGEDNTGFPDLKVLSVAKNQILGWFTDTLMQEVLRTSDKLTMLDIRGNRSITHVGLDIPSENIERLFMSHTNISQQIAELISGKWSHCLWDLDLSWSDAYGIPYDYLIDVLMTGSSACVKLRHLNISGTACSDAGVTTILSSCPLLQSLDLSSCRGISRGQKRFHDGDVALQTLRRFYNVQMEPMDEEIS